MVDPDVFQSIIASGIYVVYCHVYGKVNMNRTYLAHNVFFP